LILACHAVDDPIVARLAADDIPFVLVGRHPGADVSFVDIDSRGAAQEAVAHLLGHGYRRIAMICGPPNLIASIDRHAGYVNALQEAAIPPEPSRVVFSDFTQQGGHDAMRGLLANPARLPEAVFAASDAMAMGAIAAIQEVGLRVPEDVAIMGFDGLTAGANIKPPLSTVTQPVADHGREAVRMLLALIDDPERVPMQRFLPTRLTLRRSCGCQPNAAESLGGRVAAETVLSLA
jgi:DNA-binding LacI/PurR family transcriptional regulator